MTLDIPLLGFVTLCCCVSVDTVLAHLCHGVHVEDTGQGVGSVLSFHPGSLGEWPSGCQAWQQVPYPLSH